MLYTWLLIVQNAGSFRVGDESTRENVELQGDGVLVNCVDPLVAAAREQLSEVERHLFPSTR